jgi:hypothetical protein
MHCVRIIGMWIGLVGIVASPVRADISDLFGTWQGNATPTLRFTGNNVPFGSPPYTPYPIQLVFHGYDPNNNNFGAGSAPGGSRVSGIINSLTENNGNVTMTMFFPQEGDPTGYSDFIGNWSGNSLTGTFTDRSPAGPGAIHEHTTVSLTRVAPEPSSLLLLVCGLGGLWLCRRRNMS